MLEIDGNKIDISDLELSDDFNVINKILTTHPGKFGEICRLGIVIKGKKEQLELELKRVKAELDVKIRPTLGKVTETKIDNLISLEPTVKDLEDKIIKLKHEEQMVNTLKDAYEHRKDCLLELARNLRAQFHNTGPYSI